MVRINRKLMMTPTVSASHEMMMPGMMPNTMPLAVEIKMDGKNPSALTRTSIQKLKNMAHAPNERKNSTSASMSPLVVR